MLRKVLLDIQRLAASPVLTAEEENLRMIKLESLIKIKDKLTHK